MYPKQFYIVSNFSKTKLVKIGEDSWNVESRPNGMVYTSSDIKQVLEMGSKCWGSRIEYIIENVE